MKIDQIGKCFTLLQHYIRKGQCSGETKTLKVWYGIPSKLHVNQAIVEEYNEIEGVDASKLADNVVSYLGLDLVINIKDGVPAKYSTHPFSLNNGDTVSYTMCNYIEFKDDKLNLDTKTFLSELADHLQNEFSNLKIEEDVIKTQHWRVENYGGTNIYKDIFKNQMIQVTVVCVNDACFASLHVNDVNLVSCWDFNLAIPTLLNKLIKSVKNVTNWFNTFDITIEKEPTLDIIFSVIIGCIETDIEYLLENFNKNIDVVDMLYYLNCLLTHCNASKDDEFLVSYVDITPDDRTNLNKLIRLHEVKSLGSDIKNMIDDSDYEWNLKHRKDCVRFLCELGKNVDDLITEQ